MSRSVIEIVRDRVVRGNIEDAEFLCRMAAQIVRKRVLSESEAEVIAQLLEKIADGDDPAKALGVKPVGRPRKKNGQRKPMANGDIPDDIDVAWIVRQHILEKDGRKKSDIYKGVAKAFGMDERSVQRIYLKRKVDLGPPPTSQKPT